MFEVLYIYQKHIKNAASLASFPVLLIKNKSLPYLPDRLSTHLPKKMNEIVS